ncbi:hypothetical protein [Zunongwangia atlantica]|uniref:Uncharacterized protein n=1 Tax=Zunongwangia atlantica 22II14-10F7 TaxID=1185767 RepID=A0A1Y1SY88_9FLAO|nr:hypothetical protein [Zunongwangia atlantica]ORL43731.1 hypothetical protein IIF7_19259 [Zunongwangia atlantica 22II14-10F7]
MEDLKTVFQTDSCEVNRYYKNNPNYLIQYSKKNNVSVCKKPARDKPLCAIYFSSHDIYFPNTPQAFENQLVGKNRFEWYGTRIDKAEKHIFLRDIKKQWYLTGINEKLDSIEKVFTMLQDETDGYEIITVGSSAGGYASVLFGQLLKANYMLTFNGQFQLNDLLNNSNELVDPILFRENDNEKVNRYYSIAKYIRSPEKVYYFYSNKSDWDVAQYDHVKMMNINFVSFNTSHHGIPFVKSSLKTVINLDREVLSSLASKTFHPILFSIKMDNLMKVAKVLYAQVLKRIKRKYLSK